MAIATAQFTIRDENDITIGAVAPASPIKDELWLDTSVTPSVLKRWTGTKWEKCNDYDSSIDEIKNTIKSEITKLDNKIALKVTKTEVETIVDTVVDGVTIGDRNILKQSGTPVTASSYNIKSYPLGNVSPKAGETYTVVMKATLGPGKNSFALYNSGGNAYMTQMIKPDADGLYRSTFTWVTIDDPNFKNNYVNVYHRDSTVTAESTIEWIKIVKGTKTSPIWTPAIEDVDSAIADAAQSANNALTQLQDNAKDNKLTPQEKKAMLTEYSSVVEAHSQIVANATAYKVVSTAYVNAYNAWLSLMQPLLGSTAARETTSTVNRNDIYTKSSTMYRERQALLNAIGDKVSQTKVNELEVGGRNLVKNSKKILIDAGEVSASNNWKYVTVVNKLNPSTDYTVSVGSSSLIKGTATRYSVRAYNFTTSKDIYNGTFAIGNERQSITITTSASPTDNYGILLYAGVGGETGGNSLEFNNVKVERGTKATDWTPAPEDIDKEFDSVRGDIVSVESKVVREMNTAIEVAEGNIKRSISDMYTTKNEFGEFVSGKFNQTVDDINGVKTTIGSVETKVSEVNGELKSYQELIATYMQFTEVGLEIGKTNSKFRAVMDNQKLAFLQDATEVAYISNTKLYITKAEITEQLSIGSPTKGYFDWVQRDSGNLGLQWRRG